MEDYKIGAEYHISHSRKGKFQAKIVKQDDTWLTVEITKGKAEAICSI